jgi:hypothetical protein
MTTSTSRHRGRAGHDGGDRVFERGRSEVLAGTLGDPGTLSRGLLRLRAAQELAYGDLETFSGQIKYPRRTAWKHTQYWSLGVS